MNPIDIWQFIVEQIAPWSGWLPIAAIEFLLVVLLPIAIKFYYKRETDNFKRELAIKDATIQRFEVEIENSKQFRTDLLVQSLSERVKIGNEELERAREDKNSSQATIIAKEHELLTMQDEIRNFKTQLQQYEEQLDDLLGVNAELDLCRVCDVDEEHVMMNTIYWGGKSSKLVGDTDLVVEGVCSYCASTNLKCKVCGAITGIDASTTDVIECEGCYDTLYTPLSFFGKKNDNKIKIARRMSEL